MFCAAGVKHWKCGHLTCPAGLAKILKQQYLSTLKAVGTYCWSAPEVLLGKSDCTEKVDLFSYGVVLWEICSGESPQGRHLRPLR